MISSSFNQKVNQSIQEMFQIYLDYSLSPNAMIWVISETIGWDVVQDHIQVGTNRRLFMRLKIEFETSKLKEKSQDLWTARSIVSSAAIVNNLLFHPKRLVEKVWRPNVRGKVVIMRWLPYTFHDICPQLPPTCRSTILESGNWVLLSRKVLQLRNNNSPK